MDFTVMIYPEAQYYAVRCCVVYRRVLLCEGTESAAGLLSVNPVKLFAAETPVCGLPQARCVSLRRSVELWSNESLSAVTESGNQVTVLSVKMITERQSKFTG